MLSADDLTYMRGTVTAALPDTCTVTRLTARGALNTTTGALAAPTTSTIFTGVCRVRSMTAREREVLIGEGHEVLGAYIGTIPYNAAGVEVDDFLTVTASNDTPDMVNEEFRVVDVNLGSWQLGRRVVLEKRQPIDA